VRYHYRQRLPENRRVRFRCGTLEQGLLSARRALQRRFRRNSARAATCMYLAGLSFV
jgi:hypothetical protein